MQMADYVERKPDPGFIPVWGNNAFIIFLILILLIFGLGFWGGLI